MANKRALYYIVEHKWDGYCQRFHKIDKWSDVLRWSKDGSIQPGEAVFAVFKCRQPKIGKRP